MRRRSISSQYTDDDDEEHEQLVNVAQSFADDSGSGFSSFNVYASPNSDAFSSSTRVGQDGSSSKQDNMDLRDYNDDEDSDIDDAESIDSNIDDILEYSIEDTPNTQVDVNHINEELANLQQKIENSALKKSPVHSPVKETHKNLSHHTSKSPQLYSSSRTNSELRPKMTSPTRSHYSTQEKHIVHNTEKLSNEITHSEKRGYGIRLRDLERRNTELEEQILISQKNEAKAKEMLENEVELCRQQKEFINEQKHEIRMLKQELSETMKVDKKKLSELEQNTSEMEKKHSCEMEELKLKLGRALRQIKKRANIERLHQDEIQQLKNVCRQKEDIIQEYKQAIDALKENSTDIEKQRSELLEEYSVLKKQLTRVNEERNQLEHDRDNKSRELTKLQTEFKQFENEFKKVKHKYEEFYQTYETISEERRDLRKECELKNHSIDKLEARLKRLTAENRKLNAQLRLSKDGIIDSNVPDDALASNTAVSTFESKVRPKSPSVYGTITSSRYHSTSGLRSAQSGTTPKRPASASVINRRSTRTQSPGSVSVTATETKVTPKAGKYSSARTRPEPQRADEEFGVSSAGEETDFSETDKQNDYLDIPFYKDTRYLKQKLLTERKRVELKNIEIAGLKEMLYKSQIKSKEKTKAEAKKRIAEEIQNRTLRQTR